jgi:hypothetical protein
MILQWSRTGVLLNYGSILMSGHLVYNRYERLDKPLNVLLVQCEGQLHGLREGNYRL